LSCRGQLQFSPFTTTNSSRVCIWYFGAEIGDTLHGSTPKTVALVIVLAKLHNFCIKESNIPERIPHVYDRDRFHIMNAHSGYVGLRVDDPQQNIVVPTDLMHFGEHFNDVPETLLRLHRRRNAGLELPRTRLFQMIVDGHWQRPIMRNMHRIM